MQDSCFLNSIFLNLHNCRYMGICNLLANGIFHQFFYLYSYGSTLDSTHEDDLSYDPNGGLGFLKNVVVDTHFRYVST